MGFFRCCFRLQKLFICGGNGFRTELCLVKRWENSDNRIAEGKTVTAYFYLQLFVGACSNAGLKKRWREVGLIHGLSGCRNEVISYAG